MPVRALITDIDNTLFDWPAFFAPSFRAMVHALTRKLSLSYDDLAGEFKEVYRARDSLEFSFSIQELRSVRALPTDEQQEMIRIGRGAFSAVARKHLKPYPGVLRGLQWLVQQDYLVVCVTNSPAFLAQKRLYQLGLDRYITALIAWEGVDSADTSPNNYGPTTQLRRKTRIEQIRTFHKGDAKPCPIPYRLALEAIGALPADVWVIGDNIHNDLAPANALGLKAVWARYGAGINVASKDYQTLLSITNWSQDQIDKSVSAHEFVPSIGIDDFSDLMDILPTYQYALFRHNGLGSSDEI
jgi:FMN phosphatase YigB (HAD superfamily)